MEWSDHALGPELQRGAIFIDPDGRMDGFVAFYQGEVMDGTGTVAGRSLFAFYYDNDTGIVKSVSPTIVWDIAETNATQHMTTVIEKRR